MRTKTNPFRFTKLRPGQLEYVAQINANFDAFESMQSFRREITADSVVLPSQSIVCIGGAGNWNLALDDGSGSGSRDRPLGFAIDALSAYGTGRIQNYGMFSPLLTAGDSWPAAGSLMWIDDTTAGRISITPGTTGIIVGIFLDEPDALYIPALTVL